MGPIEVVATATALRKYSRFNWLVLLFVIVNSYAANVVSAGSLFDEAARASVTSSLIGVRETEILGSACANAAVEVTAAAAANNTFVKRFIPISPSVIVELLDSSEGLPHARREVGRSLEGQP
jgi:hypothetical protein